MSERLRILYLISEFMYSSQVRNLCDLVAGLDREQFDVEIGALAVGDEATPEIEKLGAPYYWLPVYPPRRVNAKRLAGFLASPFLLRRKKFDLVHSLLYQSLFLDAFLVKAFSSAKFVYTKSNLQWDNHQINWYLKSRFADRIISISGATDELLRKRGFSSKLSTIYLGVDTEYFQSSRADALAFRQACGIDDETFVFGCAAQHIAVKDHPTLIRAFELVCESHNNVHLLLCGPNHNDRYYQEVQKQIATSPYRDSITDLGTVSEMPAFYSALDCFVLPSYWEAFGYVLCEAMSCGLPCISCRILGPKDIIVENETGFFCAPSDASDMAQHMMKYILDRELGVEHGRSGRQRVMKIFSKEVMVRNCETLYLQLLGSKLHPGLAAHG